MPPKRSSRLSGRPPAARARRRWSLRFRRTDRAGAPRPLRLLRSDPAAVRSRPSCRRETSRARGRQVDRERVCHRRPRASVEPGRRSPATPDRRVTSRISVSTASGAAVTHGRPSATELPKKISENDSPTTARMPAAANRLRRVLARGAAAEVCVDDEDRAHCRSADRRMDAARRPERCDLGAVVLEEVLSRDLRTRPT